MLKERGRHSTAFLLSLAFAFTAFGFVLTFARPASAASNVMIGIDMTPAGESSTEIATCTAVQPGDAFDADVFISNAQSLVQFELRVDFNPDVVSLDSADYGYLLTQGGGGIQFPLFETEKAGRKFLAAAETSHPDNGSGVLARLHLHALSAGTSSLTITSTPTVLRPRLIAAGGVPFADSNGDAIFDGSLTGATVDVGQSCSPSTPVVTPSPVRVTPSPKPGGKTPTPAPHPSGTVPTPLPDNGNGGGNGGDGGSNQTPGPGGDQPTPVPSEFVINAPSPGAAGGGDAASSGGSSSDDNNSSDNSHSNDQTGGDRGDTGSNQSANSGGSSSSLILILAGAFAAIAILAGSTFLIIQARARRLS